MSAVPSEDAAWVTIETPLSPIRLQNFIGDLERLFRINSLLEFERWESVGNDRISFEAINLSNGKHEKAELSVEHIDGGLRINYDRLLKSSTSIQVEPSITSGSSLTITDDYSGTEETERQRRLDEVDRSLGQWGRDLHGYLRLWHRWSWLPPWRWYMQRVWQPMKPSARRITRWIVWITFAEMAVVLLLIGILLIEQ
ncbi:MAG: hypothetical protein K1565_14365 [Candidatus Thiodiazotropha sp. (ex. Lucinisca nassula)]|nr:hypothetical protein [Candidatus Thiodiazotropha sp. (ex. Lucinisca nassula)]PUB89487.1 MAG: hypothetical protein DBP01_10105 [gamma proteobacterium symbiont of Ctena orbiculata]